MSLLSTTIVGVDFGAPQRARDQRRKIIAIAAHATDWRRYRIDAAGMNERLLAQAPPGWSAQELLDELLASQSAGDRWGEGAIPGGQDDARALNLLALGATRAVSKNLLDRALLHADAERRASTCSTVGANQVGEKAVDTRIQRHCCVLAGWHQPWLMGQRRLSVLGTTAKVTRHYHRRRAERALRADVETFVMTYGTAHRACGATHLTVVRSDLPPDLRDEEIAARAAGWIIIEADDGLLLTCYRRRDAWKHIRRKGQPISRS